MLLRQSCARGVCEPFYIRTGIYQLRICPVNVRHWITPETHRHLMNTKKGSVSVYSCDLTIILHESLWECIVHVYLSFNLFFFFLCVSRHLSPAFIKC